MIPKEIDELMWTIADGTDQAAIEEFGDRYPALREELLKRIRTIKALKSGNRLPRTVPVPIFQNAQVRPTNWRLVWSSFAVAILALVAFGTYKVSTRTIPTPNVVPVNVAPAKVPDPSVAMNTPNDPRPLNAQPNNGKGTSTRPANNQPVTNQSIVGAKRSISIDSIPLHVAILLVADQDHLSVTIAPGLPNPTVKVDFQNMAPMDMMKELGQQYAFSTILDGAHSIIVIPKKDELDGQNTDINR